MTDPLRNRLTTIPPSNRGVLYELQRTFVFLLLSQRHAYAPSKLLEVLPSWYRSGLQQDSSEFGR
jgi:hypothetical protein